MMLGLLIINLIVSVFSAVMLVVVGSFLVKLLPDEPVEEEKGSGLIDVPPKNTNS